MRKKRGRGSASGVAPTQREILRDVMLAAGKYGAWMTLRELARLTRYGEASISAQLRHLRRAECGGYVLEKRVRQGEVVSRRGTFCGVGVQADCAAIETPMRSHAESASWKTLNLECGGLVCHEPAGGTRASKGRRFSGRSIGESRSAIAMAVP